MTSYPTPSNPLVLTYPGHIPSLKNRRRPVKEGGKLKLKKNTEVMLFLQRTRRLLEQQWAAQASQHGYRLLEPPGRIDLYVEIVFYRRDADKLPASDGDNAFTTIQETLKKLIVRDDNQIRLGVFDVRYTAQRSLEHATAYIWQAAEGCSGAKQFTEFWIAQQQREQKAQGYMVIPHIIRTNLSGGEL